MATLLSLPNEIKLQIIDDTVPEGIESFALCCKSIYNLAEKTLEQHKAHKMIYDNMSFNFSWSPLRSQDLLESQKLLVLSKSQRPRRYPRSVQMLSRTNWFRGGEVFKREVRRVCDSIFYNVDSPYLSKSKMKILLNEIVAGDVGAANSMLLTLLPNVERIHLGERNNHDTEMIDVLPKISETNKDASSWMQEKLSLVKLKEITIQSPVREINTKLGTLEAFMTLPSLRVVRAFGLKGNHIFSRWLYPDLCSNVTDLHFRQCTLAVKDLASLFRHLQALRIFSYDHVQAQQVPTEMNYVGALIKKLYAHAGKSLTYLNYTTDTPARDSVTGPLVSQLDALSKFSALKTLRISRATIIIQDPTPQRLISFLPPSLEELEIAGIVSGDEAIVMFDGMLFKKQTLLPNLQLVVFDHLIPFNNDAIAAYERVGLVLDQRDHQTNMIKTVRKMWLGGVECQESSWSDPAR